MSLPRSQIFADAGAPMDYYWFTDFGDRAEVMAFAPAYDRVTVRPPRGPAVAYSVKRCERYVPLPFAEVNLPDKPLFRIVCGPGVTVKRG